MSRGPRERPNELDALWEDIDQLTEHDGKGRVCVGKVHGQTGIPASTISGWYRTLTLPSLERWGQFLRYFDLPQRGRLSTLSQVPRSAARKAAPTSGHTRTKALVDGPLPGRQIR